MHSPRLRALAAQLAAGDDNAFFKRLRQGGPRPTASRNCAGTVGRCPGGQVLLWQPEPNHYRLRASLYLGDGQWRSSNNTNDLIFGPATFTATVALLNDVEQAELAVPLWAFHGHVENPEIALVEVRIPGVRWLTADVKGGTWLLVCQGVLTTGPNAAAEVIAYDAARKEITRTNVKLQR